MAIRYGRGDVKQTTTGFRGPLMVQSLTSAKSKFLSLPPVNPTHDIEILKDDETHTKASLWNEVAFDDDQIPQVDRAIIKIDLY